MYNIRIKCIVIQKGNEGNGENDKEEKNSSTGFGRHNGQMCIRDRLRGVPYIILSMAIGKGIGALLFFLKEW